MAVEYVRKRDGGISIYLEGVDKVMNRITKAMQGIKVGTRKGMIEVVLLVKKGSVQRCPRDTSNLAGSAEVWVSESGNVQYQGSPTEAPAGMEGSRFSGPEPSQAEIEGGIKFGASYAVFVHELPYDHPNGQDKFLEETLKEEEARIVQLLCKSAWNECRGVL
jgi:hypothetical protein